MVWRTEALVLGNGWGLTEARGSVQSGWGQPPRQVCPHSSGEKLLQSQKEFFLSLMGCTTKQSSEHPFFKKK